VTVIATGFEGEPSRRLPPPTRRDTLASPANGARAGRPALAREERESLAISDDVLEVPDFLKG
jgi:hypothetical protein